MTKVIKMTESEIKNFITTNKAFESMPTNAYIAHFFKGDGFSVSIYKSGKVVFQGSKLDYFKEYVNGESSDSEGNYPYNHMDTIGSDEVGTGDLFGTIVVATCLVKGKDTKKAMDAFSGEINIVELNELTDEFAFFTEKMTEKEATGDSFQWLLECIVLMINQDLALN